MRVRLLTFMVVMATGPPVAMGVTFSLDDNPAAPLNNLLVGAGFGAESPYAPAIRGAPLAPSPSLVLLPPGFGDGELLSPSPVVQVSALSHYLDALSNNTRYFEDVQLHFSVDRSSIGIPGTAVNAQAMLNQQPGDIYGTTRTFKAPGTFVGTLVGPGYAGPLAGSGGVGSNVLLVDESSLHLPIPIGGTPVIAGPSAQADPIVQQSHDNVDAFDWSVLDTSGDLTTDQWFYFSTNPDEAAAGFTPSAADLWAVGPGMGVAVPYAPSPTLGLDLTGLNSDDVDALILWDLGIIGVMEPGIDYALFSLSPGSASLGLGGGLNAADVFFTDFTGSFALYADAQAMGLVRGPQGQVGDNIDALELVPEPLTMLGVFLGVSGLAGYVRRRMAT